MNNASGSGFNGLYGAYGVEYLGAGYDVFKGNPRGDMQGWGLYQLPFFYVTICVYVYVCIYTYTVHMYTVPLPMWIYHCPA